MNPSSNSAETFMMPLGKAMKVDKFDRISEKYALQNLLNNYRDTPHPATGVPPASMLFSLYSHIIYKQKNTGRAWKYIATLWRLQITSELKLHNTEVSLSA